MSKPEITYLITRAHGLKQHLLRPEVLDQLLKAQNLSEMTNVLLKTEYINELGNLPIKDLDAYELEKVFYAKLADRLYYLLKVTGGNVRQALKAFDELIELENLRRIFRAVHRNEALAEDRLIQVPRKYQTINFSAMAKSRSVTASVELLRETPYSGLKTAVDTYKELGNLVILEAAAEKIYFDDLWKKIEKVPDRKHVKQLVGTEIDLKNLLYVISLKQTKAQLQSQVVINIHYRLSSDTLFRLIEARLELMPQLLPLSYAGLVEHAISMLSQGHPADVEQAFSQFLFSTAENLARKSPNSLVYVFAYLYACIREARNLSTLAFEKQLRLKNETQHSLLL